MSELAEDTIGGRIKRMRMDAGLTLPQLAEQSGISKSYLWNLENKPGHQNPGGQTLYAIAKVLNTTMSALLGQRLLTDTEEVEVDPSLKSFAKKARLSEEDVRMLASIRWRGSPPRSEQRWRFVYDALKASQGLDDK